MSQPTRERFFLMDEGLQVHDVRGRDTVREAIYQASQLDPARVHGELVVRSSLDEEGRRSGLGRVVATRRDGRWHGPGVRAHEGYLTDPSLEDTSVLHPPGTFGTRQEMEAEIRSIRREAGSPRPATRRRPAR